MRDIYINPPKEPFMDLWAKYSRDNELNWHPLIYHLLDAAAVTQLLWKDCLSESIKTDMASKLGLEEDKAGNLLSFWVALHDIGKAGPEFQKKNKHRQTLLTEKGFNFPIPRRKVTGFHGTATTLMLKRILLLDQADMPSEFRLNLALTLGGHHGEFPEFGELNKATGQIYHVGDETWQEVQKQIYEALKKALKAETPRRFPEDMSEMNSFFMLLAGLTTAVDWIASNEDFFSYLNADLPLEEYFLIAKGQAKDALTKLGWYGWKSSGAPETFSGMFKEFTPNQIQQSVIDIASEIKSPFLTIIEAPTGSGKTEAALYLADTIIQREQKGGIYIAMPTQATSNQMYSRTVNFLLHRYSNDEINLHLVHGAALLHEKGDLFEPSNVWGDEEPDFSNLQAHRWFLPRKRTLLAPFGVGTVDQTFLSVLKSRHFFLRLFGLSHKVLIFDEVHAYDVYMTQIFKTLLHWLHAVGTSVIILTATLPSKTRQELMEAYGATTIPEDPIDFPRISLVSENNASIIKAGEVESREIQLNWLDKEPHSILSLLENKLENSGCAAVICNTVKRAQDVFEVVKESFSEDEVILFHSRFPYCWRKDIEEKIKLQFGKKVENRPERAIVVATQVIEQSLDLDFDLMITDLAPVDLLIQRIGRLHRHQSRQNPPQRPKGLEAPICTICAPNSDDPASQPDFGSSAYIYDAYFLYRTLLTLKERESLFLPNDTDDLIQSVYTMQRSSFISDEQWENLNDMKAEMMEKQANSMQNANNYLVSYSNTHFLGSLQSPFSDDIDSLSRKVFVAPTREISPSIQIVCLVQDDNGLHILNEKTIPIDIEKPLTHREIRACLKATATINQWSIMDYFFNKSEKPPQSFQNSAALRWHYPVVFTNGKFTTDDFILFLDQQRGLYFEKREN
jgi:CRISPR-associated endonuclease/helicase Cas3